MDKLTKIVATIGPACDSEEKIISLIQNGVNVFRFNFKHNTIDWHADRIKRVNSIAHKLGVPIGTLIDLAGPEIRIIMPFDQLSLKENEEIVFGLALYKKKGVKGLSITHPEIIEHLKHGQVLLADDGMFSFEVVKKGKDYFLKSHTDGILLNNKSLNIPGAQIPLSSLIDRDLEGLKLAAKHEVDFIALSFVRSPSDIQTLRKEAKKFGVTGLVVSKIETQKSLDNIDKIIDATDGIMVARGDLGVEIPIEQVPFYQKMMIRKCLVAGKFVITATQMLQSMIAQPIPTRAEVSDIANAIYDHTDAIMLSGETASGKYPEKAVDIMRKTALFYEPKPEHDIRSYVQYSVKDTGAMICDAAYNLYRRYVVAKQPISGFIVFTKTGNTARLLSRYRPQVPIYAFTPSVEVCESLTINFGIRPYLSEFDNSLHAEMVAIKQAVRILQDKIEQKGNSKFIVVHGDLWGQGKGATTIRII